MLQMILTKQHPPNSPSYYKKHENLISNPAEDTGKEALFQI